MYIGTYLKQLRLEKGYTLNDVVSKINMTTSYLSQLENMKLSPSLDSLEKLLNFYAINLSEFFKQIEQRRYIIVKKGEETTLNISGGILKLTPLASKLQNNSLETCIVEFNGNAVIETAVLAKEINGERVIYVMKGKIYIKIDNEEQREFVEGDSINYKSYIPCIISTKDVENAEILISGIPPLIL